MAKPIIRNINCFDATKDYDVEITWTGNRSYANRIIIYNNKTNEKVYDDTETTFSLKHTIPRTTLSNGINKLWVIQAQVFDQNGVASALSDKVLFHTFHTPTFFFRDGNSQLEDGYKVTDSSYQGVIYYSSDDLEELESYEFYLYDTNKVLLTDSGTLTDTDNITYNYKGLENNTEYYIQCVGYTKNGMTVDTGLVRIYVRFTNPSQYSRIFADALPNRGCVQVGSNIIVIQYNGNEVFNYEDGMIDLNGKTLTYDEGFMVDGDFTLQIAGYDMWQNAEIFKFTNSYYTITLSSRVYADGKLRFRILVPNAIGNYLVYSDPLTFENTDFIVLQIKRINNIYGIYFRNNGADVGDYWFGGSVPTGIKDKDYWIKTDDLDTYMVNKEFLTTYYQDEKPESPNKDDFWL